MEVNDKLIDKLADLAKLDYSDPAERERIKNDLKKMLAFVEKINDVNTGGVEPLIFINEDVNVLRKDEVVQEITQAEALKNSPDHDSDYFKAPKVLERKS